MIGMEEVGNGDRVAIGVHQAGSEADEVVEVEVEDIEMVDETEEVVVVEEEGDELHLEVLRLKVSFLWRQERLNIHYGISDQCNSRVLEPWLLR